MITLSKLTDAPAPDDAYLIHIGHLRTCARCTAGEDCPAGQILRRAVTAARSTQRGTR